MNQTNEDDLEPEEIDWLISELDTVAGMYEDGVDHITINESWDNVVGQMRKAFQLSEWEAMRQRVREKLERQRK